METDNPMQFAIIGGGIAGLTLAIALNSRGVRVHLYERAARFEEIGAGVSLSPNALQAMRICHPGIFHAFEQVATKNVWASKQHVWFDYYDGQNDTDKSSHARSAFSITNDLGQRGLHRAHFLDRLAALLPDDISSFGKAFDKYEENADGSYTLLFQDGSKATADAIIACDGIKSRVRQCMFGVDHPCAFPSYTYKYAYRALVPMEVAIAAIGEEKAQNACMHMGKGGHMLTFPVNHGQTMNIVAFHTTKQDWPDYSRLTAPATRNDALRDFEGFGYTVTRLLQLSQENLDVWAIFDLGKHPPPSLCKGRICLSGDAAHATSPHHGAGAGFCIEDSAVLASLLSHKQVKSRRDVELAFGVYDSIRRERAAWLVQSSAHIGNVYEWLAPGIGDDFKAVEEEIKFRNGIIANVDVQGFCDKATEEMERALLTSASGT